MDLRNKIVVLTGATSGIGLAAAKALCEKGAWLIGIGRSEEKCRNIQKELSGHYPEARTSFLVSDLSSLKNVRLLAEEIKRTVRTLGYNQVDILINNAGTFTSWYTSSAEGYEMQFAVNHLAHFLLTCLLFPLLKNSPASRIISVSSGSHYHTRIHWKDVFLRKHYNCLLAYKQSKLANVLFIKELQRRLQKYPDIRAFAADPGLVNTEMGLKNTTGIAKYIWSIRKNSGDDPSAAANSIVYLASEESILNTNEIYFKACKPKKASPHGLKEADAARLWEMSERMCGIRSSDFDL